MENRQSTNVFLEEQVSTLIKYLLSAKHCAT